MLPEVVAVIRRSSAAKKADAGDRRKDFKKKEPAAPAGEEAPKKPTREAHNAERAKNSYNNVPPPDAKKDKQCKYCFTQMWHSPDRCFTGSRDVYVPRDFHKKRLHSIHEHEVNNAKMREYNFKHMFPKHEMGITTEEWLKLPEAKQQRAAASADRRAQALSEDEEEYDFNCNQREEYAAVEGTSSAGEEEVMNDQAVDGSMPETYTQIAATMVAEGTIHLPKDIDALLALEKIEGRGSSEPVDQAAAEVNEHQVHDPPETVLPKAGDVATRGDVQADIQELPLDEMPDGVVDLVTARRRSGESLPQESAQSTQSKTYWDLRLHCQRLSQHVTEDDSWAFIGDYTTYIPPTGKSVIRPKNTGMTTCRSKLRRLQQEVEMLQRYPSGEVAGILMWNRSQRVFCVQPEAVKQHIDLMEATLEHGGVDNSRELVEELQFPHWYESSGTWRYQILRYLQRVDMDTLREDLHKFWQRCGHLKPPLEPVTLAAKGPTKFYPVDDGEGGGEVFIDNASAH
ncbi:hypothetical protein CYMTET_53367 [Cymbomonas tetramitiformis]|uniref:Uncharacterized protein n=1 Tax=Cymbomonas tetramitiformis TaxID=36881 RepID=A0AAE0BIU3_9CHLO|nr:hypothetical protein CYMTET_53367 [Cymbomonas tetramitiformis]